jgi:hypothetical protein
VKGSCAGVHAVCSWPNYPPTHPFATGDPAPVKMFDRNEHLAGTLVISYAASADGHWLMVVGIKAGAPGGPAVGCMQLYSVEKRVSQPLDAHAGCFTTAKLPGRADTAMLFCFVQKKPVRCCLRGRPRPPLWGWVGRR